MEVIILAATKRSGSTLLQRIFNARKKTLIWGEHLGVVNKFYTIYKSVKYCSEASTKEKENYFGNNENPNHWIANITPEKEFIERATTAALKKFLDTLYSQYRQDHDLIGFKETRYGKNEYQLLRKCYPETAIIFLIRNPVAAWKSLPSGWRTSVKKFAENWMTHVSYYYNINKTDKNSYLLKYEDIVAKKSSTISLISKLAKISPAKIEGVLAHKIGSFGDKSITEKDKKIINNCCNNMMSLFDYQDITY